MIMREPINLDRHILYYFIFLNYEYRYNYIICKFHKPIMYIVEPFKYPLNLYTYSDKNFLIFAFL